MKRKSAPFLLAACALASTALVGCGGSSSSASSGSAGSQSHSDTSPVRVLAILDTSGPTAVYGKVLYAALQAATEEANSTGGIGGHKLSLTLADDAGVPADAVNLAVKAFAGNPTKYALVYAGTQTTEIDALKPVLAKFPVVAVSANSGSQLCAQKPSLCPRFFSVSGNVALSAPNGGRLFKSRGITKVGILEEQDPYLEAEDPFIVKALQEDGIKVTQAQFPANATDLSSEMNTLKNAGAEGVWSLGLGAPAGYTLAARAQLKWKVPVVFDVAGASLDVTKLVQSKSELADVHNVTWRCEDGSIPDQGLALMLKLASPQSGIGAQPCLVSGLAWDGLTAFVSAARQAKSTSASAVLQAMENLSPTAQRNPLYITGRRIYWTRSDHDNQGATAANWTLLAPGPITNGQVHP